MKTSNYRILTTHAGSLPRSDRLVELQTARIKGALVDEKELGQTIIASTSEAIMKQLDCGIDVGNNGEHPRESFFTYVQHRMSGFGGRSQRPGFRDMAKYPGWLKLKLPGYTGGVNLTAAPRAEGAVHYTNTQPLVEELSQFRALLDHAPEPFFDTFMTAPSPGIIAAAMQNVWYPTMEAYIDALAAALATEYRAIVDAGHVLQLDCPDLAMERHTYFADASDAEFIVFVEHVLRAIDSALADIPRDRVRMHVCWGNYNGPHDEDVPLETILPSLVRAGVGGLMLSMANPRHAHEYRLLTPDVIPADRVLIAGVIDTTTNYVEHPQVVADRIIAVARTLQDPRRVIAGTDCGFDTAAGFRDVADDVVWAKLRALSEGAALATQALF